MLKAQDHHVVSVTQKDKNKPFNEHVRSRKVKTFPTETKDQTDDTLTKAHAQDLFLVTLPSHVWTAQDDKVRE